METVGYQGVSFVGNVLRKLNFDGSKLRSYGTPDEYEDALSRGSHNGGVTAIFDEMPYIRVFLAERCSKYSIVGPIMNTRGFGFVFPRGSTLVPDVSRAILNVTEMKKLIPMENKWLGDPTTCSSMNRAISSNTLTFNNFSGLFIISGTVSTMALLVFIGKYMNKNWDELRTMSLGSPLWRRMVAWVRHYNQMDPNMNLSGNVSIAHRSHVTSTAAVEVEDSMLVANAPGVNSPCESSPVEVGYPERPSTSTELEHSSTELQRNHSSVELARVNG